MRITIQAATADQAYREDNPAIILLRLLQDDPASLAALAARLGSRPEVEEDSFLLAARELEPPRGTA